MALPIFLTLVSMALAAPQLSQSAKNLQLVEPSFTPTLLPVTNDGTPTLQAVDLPTPFLPPPLSLQHGGEHVYVPIPRPGRNPVPSPFRPQRLNLLNGDLRTPVAAPRPSLERRDDDASVSPPLTLSIGGERTLNSLPSPAIPKRDAPTPSAITNPILTTITPSPNAPGIPITQQSQTITSYTAITRCSSPQPAISPSQNLSSTAIPSSCTITLAPIVTPICHTTLSPLAAQPIPVTACDQYVTFSSEYGYTLVPANRTSAPAAPHSDSTPRYQMSEVKTLTTYSAALWEDVKAGEVVSGEVREVVCGAAAGCRTAYVGGSKGRGASTATKEVGEGVGEPTTTLSTTRTSTVTVVGVGTTSVTGTVGGE
ncbi:MAG: hypothetical protein Q9164_000867 [Protoblastenia rupestris]